MTAPRVAVVTGANKGIGLAIVRSLALTYPTSHLARSSFLTSSSSASTTQPPTPSTPPAPFLIYLTSRDTTRGQAALQEILHNDEALRASNVLKQNGGAVEIRYRQLDVGERDSVDEFVEWIGDEHGVHGKEGREGGGGLSVLVNNAGVWEGDDIDPPTTATTLHTNYHAPLSLSLRLLPILRASSTSTSTTPFNPRIINISSLTSKLRAPKFSPSIIGAFRAAIANRSVADVTALMDGFEEGVAFACEDREAGQQGEEEDRSGKEKGKTKQKQKQEKIKAGLSKQGWPPSPYAVSKAGLTAVSMILGREELRLAAASSASASASSRAPNSPHPTSASSSSSSSSLTSTSPSPSLSNRSRRPPSSNVTQQVPRLPVLINAVCPGYVKTDMTLQKGRKSAEQGAELPVTLALEDVGGVGGEFWERGGVGVWDDGGVIGEVE